MRLICESAPYYFEDAHEHYRLNMVDVEVRGDCGSDPMSIVKFAQQRYRQEKDAGNPFDKVFCVFDKDGHTTYAQALDALASATPKDTYFTINSVPCFEYWILLHFKYSTRPFPASPGNSACNQVLRELKEYIPNYEKGRRRLFSDLIKQLDQAKDFADRVLQESERNQTDNPSTHVHQLVRVLQDLKPS